jgi:hypothetical protein
MGTKISFKDLFKKLFQGKEPEGVKETVTIQKEVCFICGESEPSIESIQVYCRVGAPTYAYYVEKLYHKECVEQLVCNSDKLPIEIYNKLGQAMQVVQQWKENEKEQKEEKEEFQKQLSECKEFLCSKESR